MNLGERVQRILNKPGVKPVAAVLIVFIVAVTIRSINNSNREDILDEPLPSVEIVSAASLSGTDTLSVIGTVRAFTEAEITSERAGRITSVRTKLGSQVGAGQIVATMENASEQAAVLQAEGAYDAAVAAAAQTGISKDESDNNLQAAKNSLVTTLKSAYNTTNSIVRNDIDDFFSNPDSFIPGLRLEGRGMTGFLNSERVAYQTLLPKWQSDAGSLTKDDNLTLAVNDTKRDVARTVSLLDSFITLFSLQDSNGRYTDVELTTFSTTFSAQRASLLQTISSIENAQTALENAEEAAKRATVSASGGSASTADAQVKQALGSLRSAQANLAKTVLRSPIAGTVNSLDIKVGDFVGSFEVVSIVANNEALEIVTYVGDQERDQLVAGDKVLIEGLYEGIITQIAPAVDQATRKTEVRIATENTEISNGDTVRITKETEPTNSISASKIYIPITAVKFEADNGYIFRVVDGEVTSVSVEIGEIRGSSVEITSGLTETDEFVKDSRGLSTGTKVEVKE